MALDPTTNFAKCTVSTGYSAADLSVALSAGEGTKLPQPSTDGAFNVVWYNSTDYGDPADDPNVEIVRCTARSTDTLTVTRAQEGTSASTKNTSGKTYKMILAVTKKMMDDITTQFFLTEDPTGDVDDTNADFVFTAKPKAIVVNGRTLRENKGWTWNSGTLTATLTDGAVGTGGDIFGIM